MHVIGQRYLGVSVFLLFVAGLLGSRGFAADAPGVDVTNRNWAFGEVQGVAVGPDGSPVQGAAIRLHRVDGKVQENAISAEDGSFAIGHLAPGVYEATATAHGYADSHAAFFDIMPGSNIREELELHGNTGQDPQTAPATAGTTPAAPTAKRGFFTRLGHAYLDDWTVDSNGAPAAPEPARRGTPRPLNSPPFPSADWPIGGTVVLGAPDYQTYILMQAINENKSRVKMYGWFDIGGNASTSNKGK
jgi:hypothetical protein